MTPFHGYKGAKPGRGPCEPVLYRRPGPLTTAGRDPHQALEGQRRPRRRKRKPASPYRGVGRDRYLALGATD